MDAGARNRETWSQPVALAEFADLEGWTDPGEPAALALVAPHVRGRPILDVGAGAGRLAPVLRLLTDDYLAVDYTPAMVELFRRNHPDLAVQLGDARDLSGLADGRFGLAVFSFSGVDGLDHEDRALVLRELRRVLAGDGWLVLSTHNLDGPSPAEAPWRPGGPFDAPRWYRAARWAAKVPSNGPRVARSWRNWARLVRHERRGDGWAQLVAGAHEFNLLVHYTTRARFLEELAVAGFDEVRLVDSEAGRVLAEADGTSAIRWFHAVATRSGRPGSG